MNPSKSESRQRTIAVPQSDIKREASGGARTIREQCEKGEIRKVCANPACSIHHPKKQPVKADAGAKAEQEKQRREEAIANATGIRVLNTIVAAVPVRLMKRDLLFIAEGLLTSLDERKLAVRPGTGASRPRREIPSTN